MKGLKKHKTRKQGTTDMWNYKPELEWTNGKRGELRLGNDANPITVSTPPEFGGPEGCWTPEDLMAASIASCIMTSALFFLDRAGVELDSYTCDSELRMDKTKGGLALTGMKLALKIKVNEIPGEDDAKDKARQAVEKAEATCPLSAAVMFPIEIDINIT
jgi:organic hydroperoxide reductase OsmC/OhrA